MSKFDDAVQNALSAGQDYLQALQDLEGLVREVSDAVSKATGGAVTVDVAPGRKRGDLMGPPGFGSVEGLVEDKQRLVVIAKGKNGSEILWRVKWSADGYPISVIAQDESLTMCVTREDLEQTFIELLQQGVTGRKIKALQEQSTKQAS